MSTQNSISRQIKVPLQVSIQEAGRLLSLDKRTIYRLLERGDLASVGRGRMRRIPVQSLIEYQQRHWRGPTAERDLFTPLTEITTSFP